MCELDPKVFEPDLATECAEKSDQSISSYEKSCCVCTIENVVDLYGNQAENPMQP